MNKRRGSPNPSPADKKAVIERDNSLCVLNLENCQGTAVITDHRANRQAGGSRLLNDPCVLVGACVRCNGRKEDSTGQEREELIRRGLIVLPASTHEKTLARCKVTPVEYPDGEKYILADAHTRIPYEDWVPF
jgi:5-methylcytosine-specific restriction endonuclease McrA